MLQRLAPFWSLAGGAPGSGRQWVSWIHRDDLVDLMLAALVRPAEFDGVLNATAPHPVRMGEFCATLAHLMRRPFRTGIPSALIRALLGDAASVVLEGQRVTPQRAQALGFRFRYPTVEAALTEVLGHRR
jgi:NAD dependent epimerase/dehydratase family enzyme